MVQLWKTHRLENDFQSNGKMVSNGRTNPFLLWFHDVPNMKISPVPSGSFKNGYKTKLLTLMASTDTHAFCLQLRQVTNCLITPKFCNIANWNWIEVWLTTLKSAKNNVDFPTKEIKTNDLYFPVKNTDNILETLLKANSLNPWASKR